VIDASRASQLSEIFRPGNPVNQNAGVGNNWANAQYTKAGKNSAESPCCVEDFIVNTEPHTGASPSVRVCVEPEFARCVPNNGRAVERGATRCT
jgi:hypothetical protein